MGTRSSHALPVVGVQSFLHPVAQSSIWNGYHPGADFLINAEGSSSSTLGVGVVDSSHWMVCYLDFAFALGLVVRFGLDRELDAEVDRRREPEALARFLPPLPFATAPVGSFGSPAASRSFRAISAISSGA
jgi:hypothetical protein